MIDRYRKKEIRLYNQRQYPNGEQKSESWDTRWASSLFHFMLTKIIGDNPADLIGPSHKELHCRNLLQNPKYKKAVHSYFNDHNLDNRHTRLHQQLAECTHPQLPPAIHQLAECINRDLTCAMEMGKAAVATQYVSPWSIKLMKARKLKHWQSLWVTELRTQHNQQPQHQ